MALNGPIVLIEDDENDVEVVSQAIGEIGVKNKVITFTNADDALDYLITTKEQPFFILCDIRLPALDGLSFRSKIINHKELKKKAIPFLFFTGLVTQEIINRAFVDLDVQGFYQKENSFDKLKMQLLTICMYWKHSLHPNRVLTLEN